MITLICVAVTCLVVGLVAGYLAGACAVMLTEEYKLGKSIREKAMKDYANKQTAEPKEKPFVQRGI